MTRTRVHSEILALALVASLLSSCGGGSGSIGPGSGGSSGGGGGGGGSGGGGTAPSISILAPSNVMVGLQQGGLAVLGQGLTSGSQVLIDGQPAPSTVYVDSGTLQATFNTSLSATTGVHQVSVSTGSVVSNSLPYTVYAPQLGLSIMQALPGFQVSPYESDPTFIAAADINGDGLSDVIMPGPALNSGGSIALLLGQAGGTLSDVEYLPVAQTPYALAVGDVDGDGTADLVSIASQSGFGTLAVSILLGDGHGNFQQPIPVQTFSGLYPSSAALSDLDGDGKPDLALVVQQLSGGTVLLWLKNTGSGFAAPTILAATANNYFSIADFNGDSKPDILYSTPNTATSAQALHILMNQGVGHFSDQAAGGLNGIVGLATVVDFNLDGVPDLIVQIQQNNQGVLYSFAGNGNGSFTQVSSVSTPAPMQLVSGDFDHDGFPDLAGPVGTEPSELIYFFGDGRGNFTVQTVVGPEGYWVAAGDFNGDGIPDVVVPDRFNFVSLALGRKDRNFPSPLALSPATVTQLSVGDINGDGLPEIFSGGNLIDGIPGTVFQNLGNGSFQFAANTDPSSFMMADLTGKGVVDLIGGNTNLEIWPNNGTFGFSSSPITSQQPTANATVADMDRDGFADVVSACVYAQCLGQVFYGNGAYQFTPVTVPNLEFPFIVGDFNGDGKLDIATGSAVFLNAGNRTFNDVPANTLPLVNGAMVAVGDFDGDGKDDVAINLPGESTIDIYYSRGDGRFYEGVVLDPGQYPGAMAVGDFNGDGRTDLAIGLMLSHQGCLFLNLGNGQFTRSFFASGADAIAIVSSDLNRDGKPDLVIGNFVLSFEPANLNVVFHK